MITKEDALAAYHGKEFYFLNKGKVARCRVSGKVKTWKTRPLDWKIPVKYGLYENAYIGTTFDAEDPSRFFLTEDEVKEFLAPEIKGRIQTKKRIKELNNLLTL